MLLECLCVFILLDLGQQKLELKYELAPLYNYKSI